MAEMRTILLVVAVMLLLGALYDWNECRQMKRHLRRGQAEVLGLVLHGDGTSVPVKVRLMREEGSVVCHTQPCKFGFVAYKVGQQVDVLYYEKKEFGRKRLNVFIQDGSTIKPHRLYGWTAVLFGLVAVIMLAVDGILILW